MRSIRSVVALVSTVAVMGCQTAVGAASAASAAPAYASAMGSPQPTHGSFAGTIPSNTRAKAAAPAAEAGGKSKTILIVALVAAILVAGVLLIGDGVGGSSY